MRKRTHAKPGSSLRPLTHTESHTLVRYALDKTCLLLQLRPLLYHSPHSFRPFSVHYPPSLPALSHVSSAYSIKLTTSHTYNYHYHLLPLQSWCDLFGYEAVKVIGQTCKMLQGEETEMDRIEEVMNGVKVRRTPHHCPMSMHLHNPLYITCYHTSVTIHLVDRPVFPPHYHRIILACYLILLLLFNYRSTDGLEALYLRTTTRMERK